MINKTEAVIIANWKGNETPLVSCCCMTFNQESTIEQALDNMLMQETDFPFEIIVRDDCSQDGTTQIIEQYKEKFPIIITPIYEDENQYSKGVRTLPIVLAKSKGRYIAICEGDDYWTDSNKLQRQFCFLEEHPNYSATAENTWVQFESGKEIPFSCKPERDILIEELVSSRQFSTGSLMFRASPGFSENLKKYLFCDTPLALSLAKQGEVRYFDHISSVYRRHSSGVTNRIGKSKKFVEKMAEYQHQLDDLLDKEYSKEFNSLIAKTYFDYAAYCLRNNKSDFSKFLYKAFKYDSGATIKYIVRKYLFVDKLINKLMSFRKTGRSFVD